MSDTMDLYDRLFRDALRTRLVEERIIDIYPSDKIQSPVHLSIGQEAVAAGICACLEPTDPLFPTYRSHAFYLSKGGGLNEMFAELYGKTTGHSAGKAGSMHLMAPDVSLMTASAIVGSTIPHGVGAALAAKTRDTGQVAVVAYGDGAAEEGVYHESLNLAALLSVPVIFVCENNNLAIHSHIGDRQAFGLAGHAGQYGIATASIAEGYDPKAVHDGFRGVVDAVRTECKPYFVEISTFRYREHVGIGDDFEAGYRSREQFEAWQKNDPLINDEERIARFSPEIIREIDAAVLFAENSPEAGSEQLYSEVL